MIWQIKRWLKRNQTLQPHEIFPGILDWQIDDKVVWGYYDDYPSDGKYKGLASLTEIYVEDRGDYTTLSLFYVKTEMDNQSLRKRIKDLKNKTIVSKIETQQLNFNDIIKNYQKLKA